MVPAPNFLFHYCGGSTFSALLLAALTFLGIPVLAAQGSATLRGALAAVCAAAATVVYLCTPRFSWQGFPALLGLGLTALALALSVGAAAAAVVAAAQALECAALACAALTALCLWAFPLVTLPTPTGPYAGALGTVSDTWAYEAVVLDEAEGVGLELRHSGLTHEEEALHVEHGGRRLRVQQRRVNVQIFYPAARTNTARAPFWTSGVKDALRESRALLHEFSTKLFELPEWVGWWPLSHVANIVSSFTHAAPLAATQPESLWPVVIYSHGLFGWKSFNSVVAAEIASHGFCVVGLEHPGDSIIAMPAGGSQGGSNPPQLFSLFLGCQNNGHAFTAQSPQKQVETYRANLHLRRQDLLHVAQRLQGIALTAAAGAATSPAPASTEIMAMFGGRLDCSSFGTFGHSYGSGTGFSVLCTHGACGSAPSGRARADVLPSLQPRVRGSLWTPPAAQPDPVFSCAVGLDPWHWPLPPSYTLGEDVYGGISTTKDETIVRAAAQHLDSNAALLAAVRPLDELHRSAPYLVLASETWEYATLQRPFSRAAVARHQHSNLLVLKDTGHLNFTDSPVMLHPCFLRVAKQAGAAEPLRSMWLQGRLAAIFFLAHLQRSEKVGAALAGDTAGEDLLRQRGARALPRDVVNPLGPGKVAGDPFWARLAQAHDAQQLCEEINSSVEQVLVPHVGKMQ